MMMIIILKKYGAKLEQLRGRSFSSSLTLTPLTCTVLGCRWLCLQCKLATV